MKAILGNNKIDEKSEGSNKKDIVCDFQLFKNWLNKEAKDGEINKNFDTSIFHNHQKYNYS
ncbi:unnamed protein product [Paramecium sonneborni]|uniref:Uncharacterized protein n=1 Tax=Paramecium sonneborni TaxID=65129 RepID=A0A8S1Q092_9CILI|nr:unnamed protein product [Paramecium sonneborni]